MYISGLARITSCFNAKKEERSYLLHQLINQQLLEFYVNDMQIELDQNNLACDSFFVFFTFDQQ